MIFYSSGRGFRAARFSGGGGIGCLILGVLGLIAAWFILKGLFKLLYWASPVLFVLALIINWRAVTSTFKNWFSTMETNPLGGLLQAALAVLLFPVFALYLFVKALGYNKLQQMRHDFEQMKDTAGEDFVDFEELESTPKYEPKAEEPVAPPVLPEQKQSPGAKSKVRGGKSKKAEEKPPEDDPEQPRPAGDKKPENPYEKLFE